MNENPRPGDLLLKAGEVEGDPQPTELAQWLAEERKWWTQGALKDRGGLDVKRPTGCFLARENGAWSFRVFTADEKNRFFGKPGVGTIPPEPG